MSGLKVAPGLTLPVDVVGESTAILAKKGAGKSNTAKVLVEETLDHGGVQVVVLDPIGHWWSLRAGANGKPAGGYPVAVFGGLHGDLPLEETAGKLLAQTAVESRQSLVLDVSGLDSNGAMQRFVYDFLEELYRLKQAVPTPLLLVLEEADEFAPQDPKGKNVPRMVGAANRISKRGRGRGIGMLYVTQRSAALNKNVLDQADTLVVMRTMGPRDRAAIEAWVKHQDAQGMDDVLPSLPSLQTGEAWFWTPQRELLKRVKVRKAHTFDSSVTPKPGQVAVAAEVKPIDVEALGAAIAATVERARENDPAELRKRIRTLEQQISAATTARVPDESWILTKAELEQQNAELTADLQEAQAALSSGRETAARLADQAGEIMESLSRLGASGPSSRETSPQGETANPATTSGGVGDRKPPRAAGPQPARPSSARPGSRLDGQAISNGAGLGKGERNVLAVLAQYPDGRTKNELAFLAGYSAKASTIGVILSNLRKLELVEPPGGDLIRATAAGFDAVGGVVERPTGQALLDQWMRHPRMGEGERRVLTALIELYPDEPTHDELCDTTGYSPIASTMGVILSKLRKLGLVEKGRRLPAQEFMESIA